MMFARATAGDKQMFIIGLSRVNINRLLQGDPIMISQKNQGKGVPDGWEICITFGETEMIIAQELEKSGMIDKSTQVKVDPRLGS